MDHIKNTARYQLSRFLQSQESFKLSLDGKDIAILMTIFDFMDSGDKECCHAKQSLICLISRVPRATLIERIKKLIKLNLISKIRKSYMNYYLIGSAIKIDVPQPDITSPVTRHEMSHNRTLYNNNYNNSYNNKASPKNEIKSLVPEWKDVKPDWMKEKPH